MLVHVAKPSFAQLRGVLVFEPDQQLTGAVEALERQDAALQGLQGDRQLCLGDGEVAAVGGGGLVGVELLV